MVPVWFGFTLHLVCLGRRVEVLVLHRPGVQGSFVYFTTGSVFDPAALFHPPETTWTPGWSNAGDATNGNSRGSSGLALVLVFLRLRCAACARTTMFGCHQCRAVLSSPRLFGRATRMNGATSLGAAADKFDGPTMSFGAAASRAGKLRWSSTKSMEH